MEESKKIKILKEGILLEKRGKVFYEKVAEQTGIQIIKDFFLVMAEEENNHIAILSEQFKLVNNKKSFNWTTADEMKYSEVSEAVINPEIIKSIKAADYEAAAISAAMSMEQNAIALYSKRAEETEDDNEKELYLWLAKWEKTHLTFLSRIDKAIREEIWYENQFWPF